MEEKIFSAAELVPGALEGVFGKMEELRILQLLEESEREAEKGIWLTHEEVFSSLRKKLADLQAKGFDEESEYLEVRANAV